MVRKIVVSSRVGEAAHQSVEVSPSLGVEPGGRLVEEEELGSTDQADGDVQPASLPARQRRDPLVSLIAESDGLDQLVDLSRARSIGGGVGLVEAAEVVKELAHAPLPMVAPRLEHDPDASSPVLVGMGGIRAEDLDRPGGGGAEALEDLDDRRLARAVRPEQRDHLAARDREAHPVEDVLRAVAHAQVADGDGRVRAG